MCRYMFKRAPTPPCVLVHLRGRQVRCGGAVAVRALCAVCVLEERCKRYPCLFPTCPTLMLSPPWPARERVGVPWELDSTGRERGGRQHGGQPFSHYEKERNQIQAKSLSIYCIPHLSRAAN